MTQLERLGIELANTRKQRGLTQTQLANLSGVGRNTITSIEQGASVTTAMLEAVAQALNVNIIALRKEITE